MFGFYKLIILFFPFCFILSDKYQLAIGTMFKNESRWIKEWIEYHKLLGVEHFYLYDNDSSDNYLDIIQPYIQSGLVEVIPWKTGIAPFHNPRQIVQWVGYQLSAFNDCIQRATNEATWLALIDIDEFIFPANGKESLSSLLKNAPLDIATYSFYWKNFGTSGIDSLSSNSLQIEKFIMRLKDNHPNNFHKKCIHRPVAIEYTLVHEPETIKHGYRIETIDSNLIRINHYYTRDREYCRKKRNGYVRDIEKEFNSDFDDSMKIYVQDLKQAMIESGAIIN